MLYHMLLKVVCQPDQVAAAKQVLLLLTVISILLHDSRCYRKNHRCVNFFTIWYLLHR